MLPRIVDVFAGAGGLALGAARAGFEVASAVELDSDIASIHAANFPRVNLFVSDLRKVSPRELSGKGDIVLVGGPPCQGFSVMGHRRVADPRNRLLQHFLELVGRMRPAAFVLENVEGILQPQFRRFIEDGLSNLAANYSVSDAIRITASDVGAPTSRTRVFFLGIRGQRALAPFRPSQRSTKVRSALAGLGRPVATPRGWMQVEYQGRSWFQTRLRGNIPESVGDPGCIELLERFNLVSGMQLTEHSRRLASRYGSLLAGEKDPQTKSVRLNLDGYCPTLRAGTDASRGRFQAVRPIHPTQARVVTIREAARLQGFPDWFQFHRTKWHSFRAIGNSVSPIVSEAIFHYLARVLR